jgi:tetratricopeptide (TPR) repeat protein
MNPESLSKVKEVLAEAERIAARGNRADAERLLRAAVAQHPQHAEAWHALGISRFLLHDLEEAARCVAQAVLLDPRHAGYQRDLGELSRRLGRLDQAAACALAATRLAPRDVDGFYNLGLIYADKKDDQSAVKAYRRALKIAPTHGLSWNNLGSSLERLGNTKGALEAYQRAIKLNARHTEAQNNLGALLVSLGRLDEARHHLQLALDERPQFAEAHYNLSSLKTYTRGDRHVEDLLAIAPQRAGLSATGRVQFDFALAKALDDVGDYDAAFTAYQEGNALQHALTPYNESLSERIFQGVLKTFTRQLFEQPREPSGYADQRTPIFIVGMPRSGTSLLEQILATHPSVHGAGELSDFDDVVREILAPVPGEPLDAKGLSAAQLKELGKRYLDRVWRGSPNSAFITDKMPANFFYLGLIHLALPKARIIHAMRDPMDSCFSCYTRLFKSSMEFTYDLGMVGRYYSRYARLMQHWHEVLPQGTILDLPYEDMIANTEHEARRVTEFVGLPWDPACLDFHRNQRVVHTASVAQVRKPIYNSSVGRWRHFAAHLEPLWREVSTYRRHDDLSSEVLAALNTPQQATRQATQQATRQATQQATSSANAVSPPSQRSAEQWHAEGIELYRQGLHLQALASYQRSLALRPGSDLVLNSMGFVLQELGRFDEALEALEACVKLAPGNAIGRLNLAMLQLKLGRWQEGWENYETRWTGSAEGISGTINRAVSPLPQWNGEPDTKARRLLVITEQGFGDIFQFGRYLLLAIERFERVGFACSPPTLRLMEWSFGDRIALFTRMPADLNDWDLQCPLMSLPRAFGTRLDSIPPALPCYLKVAPPAAAFWKSRIERNVTRPLRVGIAWAGRKTHQYDARRSIAFEMLRPLLSDQRVGWVSLQKWAPEDLRPVIPESVQWHDWTDELTDFADSAALIANLDLVISVDSSMVHLAGALARPVWMLNRFDSEWRWMVQRDDSPWYPTLRIFNQETLGDWPGAIEALRKELATLALPRPPSHAPGPQPASTSPRPPIQFKKVVDVPETLDLAARHAGGGRLAEAEQLLNKVLSVQPAHAHALHLYGVVAFQSGRLPMATELFRRAIASDPSVALFHSNLAELLRQQGQVDEAVSIGRRAVQLDPLLTGAHSNLGIALYDAGQYDAAEACQKRALELDPNSVVALNNLGSIERKRHNLSAAAQWYRKVLAVQPDYLESLSNLGAVLCEDDRPEEAVPHLERALAIKPDFAEALCNLGLAHLEAGRPKDAEALLRRSLQIKPDHVAAIVALAQALQETERAAEAEPLLWRAIKLDPASVGARCNLGGLMLQEDRGEEAELQFQAVLEIEPDNAEAMTGIGSLRLEEGRIEEAEELYRRALAIDPLNVATNFHLVQGRRISAGDPVIEQIERIVATDKLTPIKRVSIHYARGKVLDDLGQYHASFEEYLKGASIKRSLISYDSADEAYRGRRIAEVVDQAFLDRMQGAGLETVRPIFILGMPRSGTTLTEQIIASHSQVYGAGELNTLMAVVQRPTGVAGTPLQFYPDNLTALTRQGLTSWAEAYLAGLPVAGAQFAHVTDKMPANYYAIGVIAAMLPRAKIIHVKRDPIDTCVSCFTRLFGFTQNGTYDLAELGRHYVVYARLMEHWRELLPGRFLEVQYEDIVADMQSQARRLISYCGLPWEDACLAFHETKRSVRTASVTQVRQPIYASSVQRWRRVEKYLGPLIEALGDYAPQR